MPDFSKLSFKPIKDSGELTIPQGFNLASLRLHEKAKEMFNDKLSQQASEEQ